ncbi:MAG: AmmeMemoRadiSam system protein B [Proteobacteria bacterium]|nr:AmmeMemoRadiSam system protein B [Pseudomonadota bacterium]MBU1741220.1 AmmeMemoRadiSam system protein B [Pseudomonadota bacterium]
MIRHPAVAGQFYPDQPDYLRQVIEGFLVAEGQPIKAVAVVAPHAGYVYSGPLAGRVMAAVEVPETVVILGPNHSGLGADQAIMTEGQWVTPLGNVPLDPELAHLILDHAPDLTEDARAHAREHSLEVQVPILRQRNPDLKIVPICQSYTDFETCEGIGQGIARAVQEYQRKTLIVASTDMTHFESAESARQKDELAIARILALDPEGLLNTVRGHGISMCGVVPTTTALVAALDLGATQAKLIDYTNSGEVNHDYRSVVGYAGVVVD